MGWRKKMGVETINTNSYPKSNIRNKSNIQEKDPMKPNIADIADIAPKTQEVKNLQRQHDDLWDQATKLADWIDDPGSDIPWQERAARVPELERMSAEIGRLETLTNE